LRVQSWDLVCTDHREWLFSGHAEGSSEEDEDGKKNEENRRQAQAPIKSDQNMIIQGAAHTVGGQAIQCKKKM
jgi:hypothetical protein